jgi:hypothetical protein
MIELKQIKNTNDSDYFEGIKILNKYMTNNTSINSNELTYWIKNYNKKFNNKFYCYVIKKENKVIGWFQFVNFINKFIHIDYLVIEKEYRNNKIFKIIKEHLNRLSCNLIILECGYEIHKHDSIVRLYKTFGFKKFNFEYKEPKVIIDLQNNKINWIEVPSILMYYGQLIKIDDILNEIFFNHYLLWYQLYEMNFDDYNLFLIKLKNKLLNSKI